MLHMLTMNTMPNNVKLRINQFILALFRLGRQNKQTTSSPINVKSKFQLQRSPHFDQKLRNKKGTTLKTNVAVLKIVKVATPVRVLVSLAAVNAARLSLLHKSLLGMSSYKNSIQTNMEFLMTVSSQRKSKQVIPRLVYYSSY